MTFQQYEAALAYHQSGRVGEKSTSSADENDFDDNMHEDGDRHSKGPG